MPFSLVCAVSNCRFNLYVPQRLRMPSSYVNAEVILQVYVLVQMRCVSDAVIEVDSHGTVQREGSSRLQFVQQHRHMLCNGVCVAFGSALRLFQPQSPTTDSFPEYGCLFSKCAVLGLVSSFLIAVRRCCSLSFECRTLHSSVSSSSCVCTVVHLSLGAVRHRSLRRFDRLSFHPFSCFVCHFNAVFHCSCFQRRSAFPLVLCFG
jgi:hypothetical protein